MPKSGSSTPKPNTVATVAASSSTSSRSFNPPVSPIASGSTSRTRPREDPDNQPSTKRMRYGESEERVTVRGRAKSLSSQSVSSQGGLADTEMDVGKSQEFQHSVPVAPSAKKKRTRTLTTPHQSAVLHALLAESRFPTTVMREEVGRSIGLSARKVQIWFQNQRQKARRPRSQSATSATRPQQYGPFSNAPHESLTTYSFVSDQGRGDQLNTGGGSVLIEGPYGGLRYDDRGYDRPSTGGNPPVAPLYLGSPGSGTQLVGPGMPGSPSSLLRGFSPLLSRGFTGMSVQSSAAQLHSPPSTLEPTLPEHRTTGSRSRPGTAPTQSANTLQVGSQSRERVHELSRTLPPLPFDSSMSRSSASAHGLHHTPMHSVPSVVAPYSDSPFSHHPPDPSTRTLDLVLPRPFTLQPTPQWAPSSFAAASASQPPTTPGERPSAQVRERPILDWAPGRGPSSSALTTGRVSRHRGPAELRHQSPPSDHEREATPRLEPVSPPRSRFDPVRSAFVPYSTRPGQSQSGGSGSVFDGSAPRRAD